MNISTSDMASIGPYLRQLTIPASGSHKGQNGKVLIIGGSSLFHSAVIWSAEAASHIVDMVHLASTSENNDIIKSLKTKWQTGMVVSQKDIPSYAEEDSTILIGNGMMRSKKIQIPNSNSKDKTWEEILRIADEGEFTREIVQYLISRFPGKQFVFDAGALQVMDPSWLTLLDKKAVITPHQKEFQTLFGVDISGLSIEEKENTVTKKAGEYSCIILLKAVDDIVSDGSKTVTIRGGNAGLTKGGTGDILAGLTAGLSATSDPFISAISASFLLKKTAETVFETKGYWYTTNDILISFGGVFHKMLSHS